jgi:hypothetical protein
LADQIMIAWLLPSVAGGRHWPPGRSRGEPLRLR